QACLDHLKAAHQLSSQLNLSWGPLFVSGWSQGGWATLSFLHKLEEVGIPVAAAAASSGPTDSDAMANGWIHALAAYPRVPGLASGAIRPEYLEAARDLYRNKITYDAAKARLPEKVKDLFNADFLTAGDVNASLYWQLAQQSQSYRWRAKTP